MQRLQIRTKIDGMVPWGKARSKVAGTVRQNGKNKLADLPKRVALSVNEVSVSDVCFLVVCFYSPDMWYDDCKFS
jgi:hypothetical protein